METKPTIAYAIVTKDGVAQKIYYSRPNEHDLTHWDRDSGWEKYAPHRIIELVERTVE
jgi:hypothetical protein